VSICCKLVGFWYQKQCFGLSSHPIHCCVGLFGVNSITFCKNTLPATSVVVLVLKEPTKKALWLITTCNNLEGFWYQKQCFGLLAHPVHCYIGLIGVKSITFSGNTLFTISFVVFVLKWTNNGFIVYSNFQQMGRFLVPKTVFCTLFAWDYLVLNPLHLLEAHCLHQYFRAQRKNR
jgi:hypothetical protein